MPIEVGEHRVPPFAKGAKGGAPIRRSSLLLHLFIVCLLLTSAGMAQSAPHIFYSDLDSGPNLGGQNNKGAFVTIYGRGFGASRGTASVTVGDGPADNYPIWSDTKIAFQLGTAAHTGDIVVHAPAGVSNGVPFTVRPGSIYFVSTTGKDTNKGGFAAPWRNIPTAKVRIAPGDIAYVMDGVTQPGMDDFTASLAIASAGKPGRPKALVAYPGAKVVIGSSSGPEFGLRTPSIDGGPFSYWTIAGFFLRGGNQSVDLRLLSDWRIVANDISCPNGDGTAACFQASASKNLKLLGNFVHDSGRPKASKHYHSVYFTTDTSHVEVGWNTIANNNSCRGIQFHSSPNGDNTGFNQFDLIVHDNLIHGQACDGINFATIDPSQGPVLAYNNIIYSVGLGPDPPDGTANYACINSPGITNRGAKGSGTAEWFNNTLYDCGPHGGADGGAFHVGLGSPAVHLRNNIVYLKPGENYLEPADKSPLISGENNLWFGAGRGPGNFKGNVAADPAFVNPGVFDFHLRAGSPAIDAGTNTGIARDFDGSARPQGAAFDLGAFEYGGKKD